MTSPGNLTPIAPRHLQLQRRAGSANAVSLKSNSFADAFSAWKPEKESFVFFAPHDDDAVIGLGLLIAEARRQDIPVRIVVVTDGQNGYTSLHDKPTIIERRAQETIESYTALGVPSSDIIFLNFPDGGLQNYYGRRKATAEDPADDHGFTGLENHFVKELRRRVAINGEPVVPTRIFAPSAADYHQDHVAVAREIPISIFHALGGIWPECGEKIDVAPMLYWHCVYCKLPDNKEPNLRIIGSQAALQAKIQAVEAFNSQGQIASIIEHLRSSPPVEYLLEESFSLYQPGAYDYCFS
jgi:LmbE family N-acetylglucosaminyl deacetylase